MQFSWFRTRSVVCRRQDGVLNVYFSILLVVHAAVLVVVAYIQRPWRLVSCCCSPAAKYRNQAAAATQDTSAAATAGSRSSSSRSSSGYGGNYSFDMVSGSARRHRY